MSEASKAARSAMRAKAARLTATDPKIKVDSSTWTPPEALNSEAKTGMRPVSKRQFKKGGKVIGKCEGGASMKRADRKQRKLGGKAMTVDGLLNRDQKMANDEREGVKHVGGMKKGGKVHKLGGGMIGNNPVSDQNQALGKAAGMMKKGGKVKREHHANGNMAGDDQIGRMIRADDADQQIKDMIARDQFGDKNGNIPLPPRRKPMPAPAPKLKYQDDKYLGSQGFGYKKGGKIKHDDVAADKALIKKMVKPEARTGHYAGGGTFSGDSKKKVPGVVGGRKAKYYGGALNAAPAMGGMQNMQNPQMGGGLMPMGRAPLNTMQGGGLGFNQPAINPAMAPQGIPPMARKSGGRTKAGKTMVNIIIGGHGPQSGQQPMPNAPVPAPQGVPVPPPAIPQMGGGMPPMGGGMPPAGGGMPPMPRRSGGRTTHVIDHAAGGGLGRLEKIDAYGVKPPKRK
jgi:hypothetical protein